MGNDISVGAVSNINVADISPHLAALVDAAGQTRPHGRVFTTLRCRYSRNINPENTSNSQNNYGVLDPIGVADGELRWEDGTPVSVKVYLRSYGDAQEIKEIKKCIDRAIVVDKAIRAQLNMASVAATGAFFFPVSLLHQEVFRVTDRAIWMARPWVQHSILQRVQLRPYCSTNRRLWFAFQVLRALSQLHDHCDLSHGDLKIENVLVDSHGWVYLTDLSNFYKPTFLPAFDPEVFEKRYNTGVRNSCCIAPERFFDAINPSKKENNSNNNKVAAGNNNNNANSGNNNSNNESVSQSQQQQPSASPQSQQQQTLDPFSIPPSKNSDIFSAASVIVSIMNDVSCFLTLSDVLALRKMLLDASCSSSTSDKESNKKKAEHFYREKLANASSGERPLDSHTAEMILDMAFGLPECRDEIYRKNSAASSASPLPPSSSTATTLVASISNTQNETEKQKQSQVPLGTDFSTPMIMTCRPSALAIVEKYTPSVFPRSFNFLYNELFPGILCLPPDLQVAVLFKNLEPIVQKILNLDYPSSSSASASTTTFFADDDNNTAEPMSSSKSSSSGNNNDNNNNTADESPRHNNNNNNNNHNNNRRNYPIDTSYFSTEQDCSVTMERAAYAKQLSKAIRTKTPSLAAAFEVMSSLFVQVVRRCIMEQSLLMALSLIARAAPLFPDAILRDPLLPLIVSLLQSSVDTTDTVRSFALDALVFVCASLEAKLTPSNAFTFEDYILPALCECGSSFARSPACMVTLARALPITYLLGSELAEKREAMGPSFQSGYGYHGLRTITIEKIWDMIKRLLNSSHTSVVVTALRSLPPLLPHLSADIVVGQVLPMLTLWFGSNYVELRREMYRTMFEVVAYCSPQHQALATVGLDLAVGKEDDVLCIASVLEGLRGALLKKCFPKARALEYVKKTAFLITHSSREVARAAASVIEAAVTTLDPVELAVFVLAPIAPFLRAPVPVHELVKKNYDVIRPMCRVPDPTTVHITEGAEYQNWCRDLAFFDLMTPTTMSMIISQSEVDRAAQVMRDCGLDLDPFFCLRFAATMSTPSPLASTRISSSDGGENNNNNNNKIPSVTLTGPLVLFSERRGKLSPKILIRHAHRLRDIQISEVSGNEAGSPWWTAGSTNNNNNTNQIIRNSQQQNIQPQGRKMNNNAGSIYGAGARPTTNNNAPSTNATTNPRGGNNNNSVMNSGPTVANFTTAGSTSGGVASSGGANTTTFNSSAKPPKPTGVSVASHSEAHRGGVRCMVSQNQYLATGGGDGALRVWDTEDAILGAGYLDGRVHKNVFAAAAALSNNYYNNNNNSNFLASPSTSMRAAPVSAESTSPAPAVSSTTISADSSSINYAVSDAAITALHFLGNTSGHTLVVGNEVGNACVYNVLGEAADIIPWANTASLGKISHFEDFSASTSAMSYSNNLGGVVSISTPGNSEAIVFLGMAGGVVGAIDIRSPTSNAVWTAKTPATAGPLVNFMFPSRDRFWSCVSVNRGGLVALWDLRMRAIVSSTDVIIPVTATSTAQHNQSKHLSTTLSTASKARLYSGDTNVTAACICEGFMHSSSSGGGGNTNTGTGQSSTSSNNNNMASNNNNNTGSFVPSVAVATDTSGIHRYDLASMKEILSMRPTSEGSVRTLASCGVSLFSGGTDSLLRNWDLVYPERSFTISRGLEPSPPYSLITPTKVTEALPAAVDLAVTAGGVGGWVDIDDNMNNIGSNHDIFGNISSSSSGSPLHSDGITTIAIVSVNPGSSAGGFGNKSFARSSQANQQLTTLQQQQLLQGDSEQLHVCTGSRDGSIALWRNLTSD